MRNQGTENQIKAIVPKNSKPMITPIAKMSIILLSNTQNSIFSFCLEKFFRGLREETKTIDNDCFLFCTSD